MRATAEGGRTGIYGTYTLDMGSWANIWNNVLGGIGGSLFFVLAHFVIQFFAGNRLVVSYDCRLDTVNGVTSFRPNFNIRSRSRAKSYWLANIAYTRSGQPHWFDNKSVRGRVLGPGSTNNDLEVSAVMLLTRSRARDVASTGRSG